MARARKGAVVRREPHGQEVHGGLLFPVRLVSREQPPAKPAVQPHCRPFLSLLSVRPILRNALFLPYSVESAPNTLFIPKKTLSL